MKILLVGDTHGPTGLQWADGWANKEDADHIIQVGDFFAYDVDPDNPVTFIPGNHEDWKRLALGNFPGPVTMMDAGETLTLDGWTFGFAGRIQKNSWHLRNYHRVGGCEMIWLEEDPEDLIDAFADVDILVTHDAPHYGEGTILEEVVPAVDPDLHVHGHMHGYSLEEVDGVWTLALPPCDGIHNYGRNEWGIAEFTTQSGELHILREEGTLDLHAGVAER